MDSNTNYESLLKEGKLLIDLEKKSVEIFLDGKMQKFRLRPIRMVPKRRRKINNIPILQQCNTYSDEESE